MSEEKPMPTEKEINKAERWVNGSECESDAIKCETCSVCAGKILARAYRAQAARIAELEAEIKGLHRSLDLREAAEAKVAELDNQLASVIKSFNAEYDIRKLAEARLEKLEGPASWADPTDPNSGSVRLISELKSRIKEFEFRMDSMRKTLKKAWAELAKRGKEG